MCGQLNSISQLTAPLAGTAKEQPAQACLKPTSVVEKLGSSLSDLMKGEAIFRKSSRSCSVMFYSARSFYRPSVGGSYCWWGVAQPGLRK